MISSSGFQLVFVSERTSGLRIRATVVKLERGGLHGLSRRPGGRFSCHASLNSHKEGVGISRFAFNARTGWTVPNGWQTPRRRHHDSLGNG